VRASRDPDCRATTGETVTPTKRATAQVTVLMETIRMTQLEGASHMPASELLDSGEKL
jgi:hypothetical protein